MLTASARKGSVESVDGRRVEARPVSRAKPDRIDAVLIRLISSRIRQTPCPTTVPPARNGRGERITTTVAAEQPAHTGRRSAHPVRRLARGPVSMTRGSPAFVRAVPHRRCGEIIPTSPQPESARASAAALPAYPVRLRTARQP